MIGRLGAREHGASMIEFVILLPLFLFTCLFLIWFGTVLNARTSLTAAVTNGVRLAATRGRPGVYQRYTPGSIARPAHLIGAIPDVDEVHAYLDPLTNSIVGAGAPSGRLPLLMTLNPPPGPDPFQYYALPTNLFRDPDTPAHTIDHLFELRYPQYTYAIIYASQSMKMSVGGQLRFPCDPQDPQGAGCLLCRPVNPITMHDDPVLPNDWKWVGRRVAIRCDYRPSSYVITPLLRMLSMISGGVIGNAGGLQVLSFAERSDRIMNCKNKCVGDPCTMRICCDDDLCP